MNGTLYIFPTEEAFRQAVAGTIVRELRAAQSTRERVSLVLSGGSTPVGIYRLLASDPLRSQLDWSRIHLFWSDERHVPPHHPHSNFSMASHALLKYLTLPPDNVHRIETEYDPATAARRYEETIRAFYSLHDGEFPQFDLVLLGLGDDGHTASLFPNTPVLDEHRRLASEVFVPALQAHRITLTLPAINHARCVMFLVAGSQKARILSAVIEGEDDRYPAQRVRPVHRRLQWYVDTEAAALLSHSRVSLPSSL